MMKDSGVYYRVEFTHDSVLPEFRALEEFRSPAAVYLRANSPEEAEEKFHASIMDNVYNELNVEVTESREATKEELNELGITN